MKIFYTQTATLQMASLPKLTQTRIANKMRFYFSVPNPFRFAEKLTDFGLYRFRVGDYRIVVEAQNSLVFVMFIKRRDKAYKGL